VPLVASLENRLVDRLREQIVQEEVHLQDEADMRAGRLVGGDQCFHANTGTCHARRSRPGRPSASPATHGLVPQRARTNRVRRAGSSGRRNRAACNSSPAIADTGCCTVRRGHRVPLDWAMTENNLGTALWKLGERESGTARLGEAVAAFRAALEERTREGDKSS